MTEPQDPTEPLDAPPRAPAEPTLDAASEGTETADGGKAKKERVLHTRVPAVLEQELKRLADSLRIPVSNVVRTILEDALDAVDLAGKRAEGEIRSVAERLAAERARLRQPLLGASPASATGDGANAQRTDPHAPRLEAIAGAVGFTPMVLANDARCAVTDRPLAAGAQAFFVLFAEPGRHAIVGPDVPAMPR